MPEVFGWVGKILRVDLTNEKTWTEDTQKYAGDYIGGRGVAARIAWNELPPNIGEYDPENRLIIITGPLTGTLAPTSGRTAITGIAPQVYPKPWYTRSNIGGQWGPELKYAGFDGVVIQGKAEKPVYLWIHDHEAELREASDLWGLDTYAAQIAIKEKNGKEAKVLSIGPAGERLVRIAVILTDTGNASGVGGFGAVMGSKNLKAIAVRGTGGVRIAKPKKLMELWKDVKRLLVGKGEATLPDTFLGKELTYERKYYACSQACPGGCGRGRDYGSYFFKDIPGKFYPGTNTGHMMCIGPNFIEFEGPEKSTMKIGYNLGLEAGFEAKTLADRWGVNQWDICGGMVLWLILCERAGVLTEKDVGFTIDPNNPEFWVMFLRRVAFREGFGDLLAEGTPYAADKLGRGKEHLLYVSCGFAEHGAGRGVWGFYEYPYWIVGALEWATDTRDPFSDSGHAYARLAYGLHYVLPLEQKQIMDIARKLWGSEKTITGDYEYKAQPAIWLQNRGCLVSSLPLCDWAFPIVCSNFTKDGMGNTAIESKLFSAVTGIKMTEKELNKIGERIFNLERAIAVREGRTRQTDESVTPFFKRPNWTKGISINEARFKKLLNEYYELRGWDKKMGWPTEKKLKVLGLGNVTDELKRLGKLP